MTSRISQIVERLKGIECPLCNGTRVRKAVSFVDSSKTVETSCGNCKTGRIPASAEDLLEDVAFLLEERGKMVDLLREIQESPHIYGDQREQIDVLLGNEK